MGNPPYYPSNMLIGILNSSERGKTTNICCAPSLEQEEFGCVYSQNLIVICESPSIHIPYQELCITTLVLHMGKLRHQNLSYIPKIAKLLCGGKCSSTFPTWKTLPRVPGMWSALGRF